MTGQEAETWFAEKMIKLHGEKASLEMASGSMRRAVEQVIRDSMKLVEDRGEND